MNVQDQAKLLAGMLKRSDEYVRFTAAKERAFKLEQNEKLIKRYKTLQFKAQAAMMTGEKPDPALMDDIRRIAGVLQMNGDVTEYLAAEYQMNKLMSEIFKILGDAVDIDLGFMDRGAE